MVRFVFSKVKNIVEKGNNGVIQHLFTFEIMLLQGSIHTVFNPFPNKPWLLRVCSISLFENTAGKGEIARIEQFLLLPQCFLSVWRTFFHLHQNCRLQTLTVWKSPKWFVWERVKTWDSLLNV